jgi:hypothetical protein
MKSHVPSNENRDCKTMKILLNCLACYKHLDKPKQVIIIFIISL